MTMLERVARKYYRVIGTTSDHKFIIEVNMKVNRFIEEYVKVYVEEKHCSHCGELKTTEIHKKIANYLKESESENVAEEDFEYTCCCGKNVICGTHQ